MWEVSFRKRYQNELIKLNFVILFIKNIYINMDISGLPRHKPENPFNYNEDDLAEKALALEKMKTIYPTVPLYYAEMIYDLCKNNAQAKIDEIKKKIESTPFKYDYSNLQEELNKVKEKWNKEDELNSQNLE